MYYQQYRRNKFGNRSKSYNGRSYHSAAEARYAQELDLRIKAKEITDWQPQFKAALDVTDVDGRRHHITNYFVDFIVYYPDGDIELVEIKGMETEYWRLKRKLLEAVYLPEHPEMRYTVVKV